MGAVKGFYKRKRRGAPRTGQPAHVWVVQFPFVDAEGVQREFRQHAEIQTAEGAAQEAKRRMMLAMETGSPNGKEAPKRVPCPTFETFYCNYVRPVYYVLIGATPGTIERYEALWKQLSPVFGSMRVDDFTVAAWERFEVSLASRRRIVGGREVIGVKTRPFIVFMFGTILKAAARCDEVPFSVVPPYKRPRKSDVLPDCPTVDEVWLWLAQPLSWITVFVAISAFTGMRLSEVRALTRADVDLEAGRIWIRRALSAEKESTTKGKRERWVGIHPDLRPILEAWFARRPMLPKAPIITNSEGKVPRRQHALTRFYRLCEQAGTKRWSIHSVRHFVTTELIGAGVDIRHVQAIVGHANLSTTQRYAHVRETALEAAITKLPSMR